MFLRHADLTQWYRRELLRHKNGFYPQSQHLANNVTKLLSYQIVRSYLKYQIYLSLRLIECRHLKSNLYLHPDDLRFLIAAFTFQLFKGLIVAFLRQNEFRDPIDLYLRALIFFKCTLGNFFQIHANDIINDICSKTVCFS